MDTFDKQRMTSMSGVTLIEVAVVLVILSLMVGMALTPMGTQMENVYRSRTERTMEEIRDALFGFFLANGRLPCPDTDADGYENRDQDDTANVTPNKIRCGVYDGISGVFSLEVNGDLPYLDLGVTGVDAWGRNFIYQVTGEFADEIGEDTAKSPTMTSVNCDSPPSQSTISLATGIIPVDITGGDGPFCNGDIQIWESEEACNDAGACDDSDIFEDVEGLLAANVPVIVISQGAQPVRVGSLPGGRKSDEVENDIENDDDNVFIDRVFSNVQGHEFDDMVMWISASALKKQLVDVGKLP
ncbi:MAG: type II secretion system protein [Magnetococcales bacterium]|nr:type II secretion system protein [Magnetococcales bacterium]